MIWRMVAGLGATRTANTLVVRAPSRAGASGGVFVALWPIAASERAPAGTAEQAISSALTNG